MQTFKNFIKESRGDKVVFTFGRFNPPTTGHELLINKLVGASKGGYVPMVFTSHSNDIKKNPLTHKQKVFYLTRFFGNRVTVANSPARHVFDIAVYLYESGYRDVRMVVGSDRVKEFEILLNKYNGKEARHGFYRFDNIQIISAGERDPDSDDVSGMSASKMREFVKNDDFDSFAQGVPSTGKKLADRMFKDLQKAMKVRPQTDLSVMDEEIDERVLDRAQRRKRSLIMKRNAKKIAIAKKRNEKKKATPEKLKKRAEKQAVNKLRAKFAGEKGKTYSSLSTADKMAVDKKIEKKRSLVPKLAKKLMPQVKKSEQQRLDKARGATNEEVQDLDEKNFYSWAQSIAKLRSKTIDKDKYKKTAEYVSTLLKKSGENRTPEAVAADVIRKFGLKGFDPHAIVDTMKDMGLIKEDKDDNTTTRQDPDIKDKKGSQPARYYKGLSKSTKDKRDAHFNKHGKKADDDPSAYKPAPGDATAKTKPSKYTKEFKRMYGEDVDISGVEINEDADKSLKKKAEKSGVSLSVLRKVYKRGVAAWKTGHRPGTTPEQWGHARVNAFIVKKKKGTLNHDKDLA